MNGAEFLDVRDELSHRERVYYRNHLFEACYDLVQDIAHARRFFVSGRAELADELEQELSLVVLGVLDRGSPSLLAGRSFGRYIEGRLWREARKYWTYACRGLNRREYEALERERRRTTNRLRGIRPEPARNMSSLRNRTRVQSMLTAPAEFSEDDIDESIEDILSDFSRGEREFVTRAWGIRGHAERVADLSEEFDLSRHRCYALLGEARRLVIHFYEDARG